MGSQPTSGCHVVALPYPGRGHINPMMNLCKLLVSKKPDILITFVVTEEWLGFIGPEPKPANVHFATVPNVLPSELHRAKNFPAFLEAIFTKLEAPVEQLLDRLELPVAAIIADTYLPWAVRVGKQRNIPVATLWTTSASVFLVFHHFEMLQQKGHFPVDLSERGEEEVDYIPGVARTRIADLPTIFFGNQRQLLLGKALECIAGASKADYFLSTSFSELEPLALDAIRSQLSVPAYCVGPTIPFLDGDGAGDAAYFRWLDAQPIGSVLYVSLGSFLSVSDAQMEEMAAGVRDSGVRFLWVARGETSPVAGAREEGAAGLVVPWCEQLKVLCHPSVGGFWTHCGWNSALEAIYAGVPMLTCPLLMDQVPNSKQVAEDWKIGLRVKKEDGSGGGGGENLVTRQEIARLVKKLMDAESGEGREMRKRARELREACRRAAARGGSSDRNLDAFIGDISRAE
ncbi:UDP-glycosyltransferase 87A1 [Eucalyptus grandis]|uniref:UDP-glycosyltransferase 87A1 n=1 Tax=Eucalyptus grandis TaxID=71139 RepID=UPI00192E84BD|nr:UDP-glycosyltransferase 87A1 [Eucalyptus grandis]XP_039161084.1 UDP-glycosyltransferase 87A1 [Eucalyptus grandis]